MMNDVCDDNNFPRTTHTEIKTRVMSLISQKQDAVWFHGQHKRNASFAVLFIRGKKIIVAIFVYRVIALSRSCACARIDTQQSAYARLSQYLPRYPVALHIVQLCPSQCYNWLLLLCLVSTDDCQPTPFQKTPKLMFSYLSIINYTY
jgi:hypothetical protein